MAKAIAGRVLPPQKISTPAIKAPAPLTELSQVIKLLQQDSHVTLSHLPDGFDGFVVSDLARALARSGAERPAVLVHVARESQRAQMFRDAVAFAAPDIEVLDFPAWDCQAYDRVSPNAAVAARRCPATADRRTRRSGA